MRSFYLIIVVYLCSLQICQTGRRRNFVFDESPVSWTVCASFPGLNRVQQNLCRRYPDVTAVAMEGLQMAVEECQYQFRSHRWNCSSLRTKNRNPQNNILLKKGYKESAFSYAIASAGITHSIARACSMGKIMACGCEPQSASTTFLQNNEHPVRRQDNKENTNSDRWKWGGCSHNMDFGMQFSKSFLDSSERKSSDILSLVKLHNSEAGRLAVSTQMQVRCKCHGLSGNCELKTCWKSTPEFRLVGSTLKQRFGNAVLVDQSNFGHGPSLLIEENGHGHDRNRRSRYHTGKKKRRRTENYSLDLFYYEKSPNFCEKDSSVDFPGTSGRLCNRTSHGMDGCASLCCGRGYTLVKRTREDKCNCKFQWCCYVTCDNCTLTEWVSVCN